MSIESVSDKYRATRMWNDVVRTLRSSMPVGRHRKNMRVYMETFVASQAVDWLHQHLKMNPNFTSDVTRHQTIGLLQKFQKMGIIQDARGSNHKNSHLPFEDNGRLFRITDIPLHSPARRISRCVGPSSLTKGKLNPTPKRSPLKDVNRRESFRRSPAAWRHSVPSWIGDANGSLSFSDSQCQGQEVELSIPYMDGGGSPPGEGKPGAIPSAVDGARERRPSQCERESESELHIWLDVVLSRLRRLLRLKNLDDVISDVKSMDSGNVRHNFLNVSKNGLVTKIDRNEHLPYWILSSMKYLAHGHSADDLQSLPGPLSGLKYYHGLERDIFTAIRDFFYCLPEPLIPIPFYEVFVNVLVHVDNFVHSETSRLDDALSLDSSVALPSAPRSPTGRDADELSRSCAEMMQQMTRTEEAVFKIPAIPPPRPCHRLVPQVTEYLETSFDGASSNAVTRRRRCSRRWSLGQPTKQRSGDALPRSPRPDIDSLSPFSGLLWSPRYHSESDVRQERGLLENQLAKQTAVGPTTPVGATMPRVPSRHQRRSSSFHAALNSHPLNASWTPDRTDRTDVISTASVASSNSSTQQAPLPSGRRDLLIACLQICCLLIPPGRRRRLHLLLRFMYKLANNGLLRFSESVVQVGSTEVLAANRDLVICSFAETILRKQVSMHPRCDNEGISGKERSNCSIVEARDVFALQLVGFMVDNHVEIMNGPEDLRAAIVDRVNTIHRAQMQTSCEASVSRPFCKQVSQDEYESSREMNSASALKQLLESIISDPKLTTKERKKRMKQFKETHAAIYLEKFPTEEEENAFFASLPKCGVLDRTLQKLRSIRL